MQPSPPARLLLFFLRLPEPGKVKTRLAATMGAEPAAAAYRLMVETLVRGFGPGQDLRLIYTPAEPGVAEQLRGWLQPMLPETGSRGELTAEAQRRRVGGKKSGTSEAGLKLSLAPQSRDGLGERLIEAFAMGFADGYSEIIVSGSDCLDVDQSVLDLAWERLRDPAVDVVLGPATDGGYYLLALKSPSPTLFIDIPWSAENTLEVTLQRAAEANLRVNLLPTMNDIDSEEDWLVAAREHGLPIRPVW